VKPARLAAGVFVLAGVAGCATFQAYDGAHRASSEVAVISGDAKLRADMPVALVIRAVDGRSVDVRYSSVALLPGKHSLLIDCQLGGSTATASRHELDVEVVAGEHYRLQADMRPGNRSCDNVQLQSS
jgi:hypothetical protein